MRRKEAYLRFWAGMYYVHEYSSQKQLSSSKVARHALYRARKKGYHVKIYGPMYAPNVVKPPL